MLKRKRVIAPFSKASGIMEYQDPRRKTIESELQKGIYDHGNARLEDIVHLSNISKHSSVGISIKALRALEKMINDGIFCELPVKESIIEDDMLGLLEDDDRKYMAARVLAVAYKAAGRLTDISSLIHHEDQKVSAGAADAC